MDREGLGTAVVETLVQEGIISSSADLYYIKKEDIEALERQGEKSAQNLIDSIEKSKENDLSKLLFALGIRGVGEKAAKVISKKFKTLDDLLAYVKAYFTYQKYFDDHKSNKQVIDSKSGNCVDLLQFCMNYAKAMGYESKCIHVKCKTSGTGHVFGKFKHPKHTGNTWIIRDIAAVADGGSIKSVWCSDGIVQATNPSWFMENWNR